MLAVEGLDLIDDLIELLLVLGAVGSFLCEGLQVLAIWFVPFQASARSRAFSDTCLLLRYAHVALGARLARCDVATGQHAVLGRVVHRI